MDISSISNPFQGLSQDELNSQLRGAAQAGNLAKIQLLLEGGANVNATNEFGWTALMFSALSHRMVVAEFLIKQGADVSVTNNHGQTALMLFTYFSAFPLRILSIMSSQEINVFIKSNPQHIPLVNCLKQELKDNANKLYNMIMPSWRIAPNSPFSALNCFPSELVAYIRILEASVQDFPEWYRHRIKSDLELTIKFVQENKKTVPVIFSNIRKTADELEQESDTKTIKITSEEEVQSEQKNKGCKFSK